MILKYQLTTIEGAVARGESISHEMASALLAAFHEADTAHKATVFQMAQLSGEKRNLEWERDQTLKLKNELENQVDERVLLRTVDLREELAKADISVSEARSYAIRFKDQGIFLRAQLAKAAEAIGQYQELLQDDTPGSWWRKIRRARSKKRGLIRLDNLLPSDTLNTWRSYAEEAADGGKK